MALFTVLARHFFGRFFDNEIISQQGDARTNVVQALGLLASPGMFVAMYMLPQRVRFDQPFDRNWLLMGDYYFFVLYSMIVMGFIMVFEWDALFPDRKDYLVLTPLPVSGRAIFHAKVGALAFFMGLFVVVANALGAIMAPVITGPAGTPTVVILRLVWAHLAAVASAGLFVALALAAIQGVLINILPGRAFRRVSPWVQMALMGVLIIVLFLTPLACAALRPLFEGHSPLLRHFPPFWFLGLYMDLLPGRPGGAVFHELAPLARTALLVSLAVFSLAYLAGYRRHARRVMESLETAGDGPGRLRRLFNNWVNRRILPHPLERATFHFITNTILRTARHRLFIATYAGIALAMAFPGILRIGARPGGAVMAFAAGGLAAFPLTLSFFAVSGLRAVFNLPAELRANWVFQVTESAERMAHIRAVRKWVVLMGIAPLFALLAPVEVVFLGWRAALVHLSFALVLSLVLLNLLLVWFRKIPFTCSYFPGKTSMAVMGFLYVAGFILYAWTMADLEERLIRDPVGLALFYAAGILLLRGLTWLEKRESQVNDALVYEDQPDPIVRTLELG